MEIAERLGDEPLWAASAEAYGWHSSSAASCARASRRRSAPSSAPTAGSARSWPGWRSTSALSSPGACADPDGRQAMFERQLGPRGPHGYAQERADGIGRCHSLARRPRGGAARARARARTAWIRPRARAARGPVGGPLGRRRGAGARGLATSWRAGAPLGRVGRPAPGRTPRAAPARRARARAVEALERARARSCATAAPATSRPGCYRTSPARWPPTGAPSEARDHVERCREILAAARTGAGGADRHRRGGRAQRRSARTRPTPVRLGAGDGSRASGSRPYEADAAQRGSPARRARRRSRAAAGAGRRGRGAVRPPRRGSSVAGQRPRRAAPGARASGDRVFAGFSQGRSRTLAASTPHPSKGPPA